MEKSFLILGSGGVTPSLIYALNKISKKNNWDLIRWITQDNNRRAKSLYDRVAKKTSWSLYELI